MDNDVKHEGHEEIEGHEEPSGDVVGVRVPSPLTPSAERVMHQTIGCAITVHRALRPGFLESIYRTAMCLELDARHLAFERERPVKAIFVPFDPFVPSCQRMVVSGAYSGRD
jgi:hypothetical protein